MSALLTVRRSSAERAAIATACSIAHSTADKNVFLMFCVITGLGSCATFLLARDAWRRRGTRGAYGALGNADRAIVG